MPEDIMLMEMPGAFERGQHGLTRRPDVVRTGNGQNNGRQRRPIPLGVVLTGYRLLTTIVIVGIGIPKAVYSYYGRSLISPSLDWVGGVIFTLLLFWLGVIEATRPELCPSLFQVDLAPAILGFLCPDDTPALLDPATLESLRRDNTLPLAPQTLWSLRRGDTSPLAPEILGGLSDDASPPLIPEIPGVLSRGDTSSRLAPEILRTSHRDDTPHPPPFPAYISSYPPHPPPTQSFANAHPATPARSMSPMVRPRGTTPDHQNTAPTMPGFKPLPSRSAMQRGPRRFTQSSSYLDVHGREPEVDLTDLRDEELESILEVSSRTSSHSHGRITAVRQRHALETPRESASRAPSDLPDLACRLCGLMSPRHVVESFGGFCSESHKWEWESARRGPSQETSRASASRAPPNLDKPCRLCGLISPRHYVERFGGFCSESHKREWESYPRRGPSQQTARASASRAPHNLELPCGLCGLMSPRHYVEYFGGFCSESHKQEWERNSYARRR